jgi:Fic family protein
LVPWSPLTPYNDLPPIPPSGQLETVRVLKAVIPARAELARLDQATSLMPDPHVLLNTIPLLEAQASSEIYNIVTTTDELFRQAQLDEGNADPAVKETLRYRAALWAGFESLNERALTSATAVEVCSRIKGHQIGLRNLPGTRIADRVAAEIVYSPPEGSDVIQAKLGAWEDFIHRDDGLDPVVRMAAAHYQFEAIHPFTDGNGRTGRILNILILVAHGILREPVLYLSRPIIETKDEYYRRLRAVTADGAWEDWLVYMIDAARDAAAATTAKILGIKATQAQFIDQFRGVTPGMENAAFQAVLFAQPYARIAQVVQTCKVSRPTATAWLGALADAGALVSVKFGRDRLFLNTAFLQALTRTEGDQ